MISLREGTEGGEMMSADLVLLPSIQGAGAVTVEVKFWDRTEHLLLTMTWEDYLDERGLREISHRIFSLYDEVTGENLTRGATLEAMGYRGGTLAVKYR
jgi:hypothetical protein